MPTQPSIILAGIENEYRARCTDAEAVSKGRCDSSTCGLNMQVAGKTV